MMLIIIENGERAVGQDLFQGQPPHHPASDYRERGGLQDPATHIFLFQHSLAAVLPRQPVRTDHDQKDHAQGF